MTPQAVGPARAAELLGIGRTTFHRLRSTPGFPRPFVLPAEKRGTPRWWVEELRRWAESRRSS